ncbi:MAG: hypothetical protein ACKOZY_06880 [Flavobacteriales bacterium]
MKNISTWKKYTLLIGVLFLFPLIWLLFFGVFSKHHFKTLAYYGPECPNGADTTAYQIPDFAFMNQDGEVITRDSLLGDVWLAAFYNLSDPHLDKITERLLSVNFKYRFESDIRIVVFSTDCTGDLEKLKAYSDQNTRYNAFGDKWTMLTGDQHSMQSYIRNGFLIDDLSNEARFQLVDPYGQIRGKYGNTEYHFLGGGGDSLPNIMEDIALLKKELDLRSYEQEHAQH